MLMVVVPEFLLSLSDLSEHPEKMDNDKLMRTYVIPLVLDNGEQIDLIVNSKGQDMACVYLDEDSN